MLLQIFNNPWVLCGVGILFCATGVFLFFKNVYEEDRSLFWPIAIMLMGVLLITMGTVKYFRL